MNTALCILCLVQFLGRQILVKGIIFLFFKINHRCVEYRQKAFENTKKDQIY